MPTAKTHAKAVFAIATPERHTRETALHELLTSLGERQDAFDRTRFEGDAAELAEVLDELRTMSLLGGHRVVLLDDADAFITKHRKALEAYCAAPAPDAVFILMCSSMPANTNLCKIIARAGGVLRPAAPKGHRLVPWIQERAQSVHGKRIDAAAAQMIRDHVGDSPAAIEAEISKLATFAGDRGDIRADDVAALTGRHREQRVFAVLDAMDAGDVAGALNHWQQVLATDRAAPNRALAGLAWALRRWVETHEQWRAGSNLYGLAKSMFCDPQDLQQRLERTGGDEWAVRRRDLLAADLAVKTGLTTVESAVEKFIVEHTVGAVAPA